MNKEMEDYANEVVLKLQDDLSAEKYEINIREVKKTNDVTLTGIEIRDLAIKDDILLIPIFYIDPSKTIEESSKEILRAYQETNLHMPEILKYKQDLPLNKVYYSVRNYKLNQEYLADKIYQKIPGTDLCKVYCLFVGEIEGLPDRTGRITITKNMSDLPKETIIAAGDANTPYLFPPIVEPLHEVMRKLMPEMELELPELPVLCASNRLNMEGAAVICQSEVMKQVRNQLGEDFYILPSSIHEILMVPKSTVDSVKNLHDMVREVNAFKVMPEEKLSDGIYGWKNDRLVQFDEQGKVLARTPKNPEL